MNLGPISTLCVLMGIIGGVVLLVVGVVKIIQLYNRKFNYNIFPYTFCLLASLLLFGVASEQVGGLQVGCVLIGIAIAIYTLYLDIKRTNLYYGIAAFIFQILMIFSILFILLLWLFSKIKNHFEQKFGLKSMFRRFK